jgi:hypothetical protein
MKLPILRNILPIELNRVSQAMPLKPVKANYPSLMR